MLAPGSVSFIVNSHETLSLARSQLHGLGFLSAKDPEQVSEVSPVRTSFIFTHTHTLHRLGQIG